VSSTISHYVTELLDSFLDEGDHGETEGERFLWDATRDDTEMRIFVTELVRQWEARDPTFEWYENLDVKVGVRVLSPWFNERTFYSSDWMISLIWDHPKLLPTVGYGLWRCGPSGCSAGRRWAKACADGPW
jgi:hypothetical protein